MLQAHYRLGRALYYQGKVEDAQKTCSDALISHPDDKVIPNREFPNSLFSRLPITHIGLSYRNTGPPAAASQL